jgi:CRP/FNR family transcriptional regulator, cyclic AMP receptor protein
MRKVLYILGQFSEEDIEWLGSVAVKKYLTPGEVLIKQGEPLDTVYIVLEGNLAVRAEMDSTHEIARLGSGEIVGEMSFIDARPPLATVVALERSLVLSIPASALTVKLKQDSIFASHFYRALALFLSSRLRDTVGMLGYGNHQQLSQVREEELDENVLDTVHLAGSRFERLLKGVSAIG